jgi:hypothetical protein
VSVGRLEEFSAKKPAVEEEENGENSGRDESKRERQFVEGKAVAAPEDGNEGQHGGLLAEFRELFTFALLKA